MGAPILRTVVGVWRTIDDKTNKPRALVRIFERNGLLYGRVTAILDGTYADARCKDCAGDRARTSRWWGLRSSGTCSRTANRWDGGTILNPETGGCLSLPVPSWTGCPNACGAGVYRLLAHWSVADLAANAERVTREGGKRSAAAPSVI